jgi:uncharacterized protein YjbI with pentapeptide repeats
MRPTHLLVLLTLLIAPLGVCAQPAAPLDGLCPVPADDRWTPQEKFVWERVCVGKVADFNGAPGYGGKLDPKKPAGWPQNRVLRSAFLEAILLKDPYRRALHRHGVNIFGARFVETIDLEGAELQHRLLLADSLIEKGAVLVQLRSKYPVGLAGSKVAAPLEMNGLDLDANLALQNGEFAEVDLITAHVGMINLMDAKVTGNLNMNALQADRTLFMTRGEFAQVDLVTAHAGVVDLVDAKVTGALKMAALRVDGTLFMDRARLAQVDLTGIRVDDHLLMRSADFAEMKLNSAHVGGQLRLTGSKVAGDLICYGLDVGQQVFMDDGATFSGSIDCRIAKIRGDLYLTGAHFKRRIDFSGAEVGGALVLGEVTWSDSAALTLQNAQIGTIPDLTEGSWPPKLELVDFTYRKVGLADEFEEWFYKMDHYVPQPYEQLASVVQSQGNAALATTIRYSSRERERSEATGRAWAWLSLLKWAIGYGHHPEYSVLWAFGFVAFGAIVLRVSGEGPRNGMPYGLAYSFDVLLPIIRLRDKHYEIDLKTWARYYFYSHKIMGYVLASFLVAGLSGLTK